MMVVMMIMMITVHGDVGGDNDNDCNNDNDTGVHHNDHYIANWSTVHVFFFHYW